MHELQPSELDHPRRRLAASEPGGTFASGYIYGLLLFVTLLKPCSNLFLAWGMRRFPEALALDPVVYLKAMLDPLVALGIAMQILWLLTRMSLLSVADLSYVLPVTSAGYVISTLLGRIFLHEPVSASRWAGAILISLGAALVVSTPEKTTDPGSVSK
jgi:drug/metabolite transporter (DMT)-like permease